MKRRMLSKASNGSPHHSYNPVLVCRMRQHAHHEYPSRKIEHHPYRHDIHLNAHKTAHCIEFWVVQYPTDSHISTRGPVFQPENHFRCFGKRFRNHNGSHNQWPVCQVLPLNPKNRRQAFQVRHSQVRHPTLHFVPHHNRVRHRQSLLLRHPAGPDSPTYYQAIVQSKTPWRYSKPASHYFCDIPAEYLSTCRSSDP